MKKYILLKDLPHAKAGTIFEGTDEGLVNTFQYATGTKDTYHLHTYIHQEWIKAVEEKKCAWIDCKACVTGEGICDVMRVGPICKE